LVCVRQTWRDIYERLWRSFVRLRKVVEDTRESEHLEARNALIQFCRYAFELRDWMLASDLDPPVKAAVSELFGKPSRDPTKRVAAKSYALAACADIANASKHSKLDNLVTPRAVTRTSPTRTSHPLKTCQTLPSP
jgi:hypothetical protein